MCLVLFCFYRRLAWEDGKPPPVCRSGSSVTDAVEDPALSKGYLQAVDQEGNPLCLSCQKTTAQPDQTSVSVAWDTRFCSHKCQDDFLMRSNQSYLRKKVFEIEHGVCQICNLNAQELYLTVRDTPKNKRKSFLESSSMSSLPLTQVRKLVYCP